MRDLEQRLLGCCKHQRSFTDLHHFIKVFTSAEPDIYVGQGQGSPLVVSLCSRNIGCHHLLALLDEFSLSMVAYSKHRAVHGSFGVASNPRAMNVLF